MSEPPEPTREEEDAQRYAAHEDPERVIDANPPLKARLGSDPGRVQFGHGLSAACIKTAVAFESIDPLIRGHGPHGHD
jgi:hypothetical protein